MGQFLGQFTIIGQQEQPFRVIIQPTYRKQSLFQIDQIDDGWTTLRIVGCRDYASRFVEHHIGAVMNFPNRPAIDQYLIVFRVNARTGNANHLPVDHDAPCGDILFAITPRRNAGACQHLL
jgi:hypothetical protein